MGSKTQCSVTPTLHHCLEPWPRARMHLLKASALSAGAGQGGLAVALLSGVCRLLVALMRAARRGCLQIRDSKHSVTPTLHHRLELWPRADMHLLKASALAPAPDRAASRSHSCASWFTVFGVVLLSLVGGVPAVLLPEGRDVCGAEHAAKSTSAANSPSFMSHPCWQNSPDFHGNPSSLICNISQ